MLLSVGWSKLVTTSQKVGVQNKGVEMTKVVKAVEAVELDQVTKATRVTLEQVKELVEVRAEIASLEKRKEALTEEIEKAFGVNKETKVSKFSTLKHNGIEFARYDWRTRKGIDEKMLAEKFPEAYEACYKPDKTIYGVIISLFK